MNNMLRHIKESTTITIVYFCSIIEDSIILKIYYINTHMHVLVTVY